MFLLFYSYSYRVCIFVLLRISKPFTHETQNELNNYYNYSFVSNIHILLTLSEMSYFIPTFERRKEKDVEYHLIKFQFFIIKKLYFAFIKHEINCNSIRTILLHSGINEQNKTKQKSWNLLLE